MANPERVLVVDGISETAEVLRAVLEPRGLQVERVRGHRLQDVENRRSPSVVILHEESAPAAGRWPGVPRVIIGSCQPGEDGAPANGSRRLAGPFQYPELIAAIEDLLAGSPRSQTTAIRGVATGSDGRAVA